MNKGMGGYGNNMILMGSVKSTARQAAKDDTVKKKDKVKGDGINEVLVLMKEAKEFQDRIEECAESQAVAENKQQIEGFYALMDQMYDVMLELVKGGLKRAPLSEQSPENAPEQAPEESIPAPDVDPVGWNYSQDETKLNPPRAPYAP